MGSARGLIEFVVILTLLAFATSGCRPSIDDNGTEDSSSTSSVLTDGSVTPAKLSQAYLPLSGGTMSGALVLAGAPSSGLQAATKAYADSYLGGYSINSLGSITNGQVLSWNSGSSVWEPASVAGGAAATAIATGGKSVDATATTTTPASGAALVYDSSVAGKWAAGTVSVAGGGTGATSLTANGILLGNTTSAVTATAAMASGEILVGQGVGSAPLPKAVSGDVTISNTGVTAVGAGKITNTMMAAGTLSSTAVSTTGGIPIYAVASLTTAATIGAGQTVILANATAAGFTLTLPLFASVGTGQVYTIKKTDSTTNVVTISRNGADPVPGTIEGSTSISLNEQYDSVQLATDGSNWYRINGGLKSWKLIKRTTVTGAAASSISITGLDGNTDIRYLVKIHQVGAGGAAALTLRPNGDDTLANFYRALVYGTTGGAVGGTGSNDSAGAFWGGPATWTLQDCVIEIFAKSGAGQRTINFDCVRNDGSAYAITWANFWTDTTNNLTSLSFSANSNMGDQGATNAVAAYGIGTVVDVYALR